jgi:hypothetical protein
MTYSLSNSDVGTNFHQLLGTIVAPPLRTNTDMLYMLYAAREFHVGARARLGPRAAVGSARLLQEQAGKKKAGRRGGLGAGYYYRAPVIFWG